tara:strand:+ start:1916 stop:2863 length:948 start_codon:yes stop_codon:yes gene_type:complete
MSLVTSRLLKTLRGQDTTKKMSESLGFRFDKYYRWENDYQRVDLVEFFHLCEKKQVPIHKIFQEVLGISLQELSQTGILKALFAEWGQPSNTLVEKELGFSKVKWWRLRNGESRFSLEEFFSLVELLTGRANLVIEALAPNSRSKFLQQAHAEYETRMQYLIDNPIIARLYCALCLRSYRQAHPDHRYEVLAKELALKEEEVKKICASLIKDGILQDRGGLLELTQFKVHVKSREKQVHESLFLYSLEEANRVANKSPRALAASHFQFAPVSEDAYQKIREIMCKNYKEIIEVIDNDDQEARDFVVNFLQMLNRY